MVHPGKNPAAASSDADASELQADPRDTDPSRDGPFQYHNCWRCAHGTKPCPNGGFHKCDYPRARND